MRAFLLTLSLSLTALLYAGTIISAGDLQVREVAPERVTQIPMGDHLIGYMNPPAAYFTISANTDGFISAIHVEKYAPVKKGEPLFTLKSPRLLELQSHYIKELIDLDYYQKEHDRLEPLAKKGVVASKRFLETENKMLQLKASIDSTKDVMQTNGIDKRTIRKISKERKTFPYITLRAPKAMQVRSIDVNRGDYLSQGEKMATLVDPSICHLEVDLPWQIAATFKPMDQLEAAGTRLIVASIAPTIDPRSQTKALHLEMQESCKGRGGASINAMLYRQHKAWRVPTAALITLDGKNVLFHAKESGYEVIEVTLLSRSSKYAYITGELEKGMAIAASSLIALKSAAEAQQE